MISKPFKWMKRGLPGLGPKATAQALLIAAALVLAFVIGSQWDDDWDDDRGVGDNANDDLLAVRMDALEKRQEELLQRINSRNQSLHVVPSGSPQRQSQMEVRRREHSRRMRDDPAYEQQMQEQRLYALQQQFSQEPIDHRWSVETRAFTADALVSAVSLAKSEVTRSDIRCRSTTCQITMDVDSRHAYEDVVRYLMTDLAETLPGARYVVMPPSNGVRTVNIFARRPDAAGLQREDN